VRDADNVNPCLRASAEGRHPQNHANSDFQRLLWTTLFYEKGYDKRELAERLGVAVDTLHAYANGDLRLHIDAARAIIAYIAEKNPKDRRFVDYFLKDGGMLAIPVLEGRFEAALKDVIDIATDIAMKIKKQMRG
jgi:transcriptional regulator with XRE-family HTH domain